MLFFHEVERSSQIDAFGRLIDDIGPIMFNKLELLNCSNIIVTQN